MHRHALRGRAESPARSMECLAIDDPDGRIGRAARPIRVEPSRSRGIGGRAIGIDAHPKRTERERSRVICPPDGDHDQHGVDAAEGEGVGHRRARSDARRASLGTASIGQRGSASRKLIVGGAICSRNASIVTASSSPPLAPSAWPWIGLVDDTGTARP